MKIFISSDMEGTAGVVDWSQCMPGEREYEYYRRLLQAEVNAAIDGAQLAGATSFLVNDSHSSMQNLLPDQLHGRAAYLSGRHKPLYMMQGLDASFDGCFFVSYHGVDECRAIRPVTHVQPSRDCGGGVERHCGR
jgi:D-amino peptidase